MWERGASVDANFDLFNFQLTFYVLKNIYKTLREIQTTKRQNKSPFTLLYSHFPQFFQFLSSAKLNIHR